MKNVLHGNVKFLWLVGLVQYWSNKLTLLKFTNDLPHQVETITLNLEISTASRRALNRNGCKLLCIINYVWAADNLVPVDMPFLHNVA